MTKTDEDTLRRVRDYAASAAKLAQDAIESGSLSEEDAELIKMDAERAFCMMVGRPDGFGR